MGGANARGGEAGEETRDEAPLAEEAVGDGSLRVDVEGPVDALHRGAEEPPRAEGRDGEDGVGADEDGVVARAGANRLEAPGGGHREGVEDAAGAGGL